ncbi:I78 family peptidase inhibitor [Streptomyces sp. SL13]|uniref:I78 family peptidase inhibitor n=1 Tax=Streptantibioticus silvisoli TaxID=2705255 RepID=A0AA90H474_9ACTN|nr:I78 family peptidase inhibitor [Streptantibioticus silvisoli]MDI5966319.1 I78 family peptidase inhibitor [Streptantibioticus silvisoli]MDI5971661.1 I78 family peptidase inhibitor [Streptantibioticus silvisoli]
MTPLPGIPQDPHDDLDAYVGLDPGRARERAADAGWRTVRVLPPDAVITLEYVAGRLNLTVADGAVTRCWRG